MIFGFEFGVFFKGIFLDKVICGGLMVEENVVFDFSFDFFDRIGENYLCVLNLDLFVFV